MLSQTTIERGTFLNSFISRNAVRLYAATAALLALGVHYAPSLPVDLILAAVAAVLGLTVDQLTVPVTVHQEAMRKALNTPVPAPVEPASPPAAPAAPAAPEGPAAS